MQAPKIQTAIPQRRYQVGDHQAVILGEIESGDHRRYQYILALVRNGEAKPRCYVTAERAPRARRTEGSHVLRLITEAFDEELSVADTWGDLERFAGEALTVGARALGIDATPVPL